MIATILRGTGSTGVETHIRELLGVCNRTGQDVSLVTPFSRSRGMATPIFGARLLIDRFSGETSVAWYRTWHYRFLRHALSRELARAPGATVYANCPLSAMAALRARKSADQRVVMAVHFDTSQADEWVDKGRIARGGRTFSQIRDVESKVLPALDGIVYLSASARRGITSWLPVVDEVPSTVVPNFVGEGPPVSSTGNARHLISVGGLERPKNHEFLLHVLANAKRLGFRYTLDIAGEGPCRSSLERLRSSLALEDQVRLLGYRPDVRSLLPGYRAYVHASVREVMGMAAIEALAAGLPVIAVPVGGFPEIIEPGVEGLFWSASDPEGAARLLIGLMEDPARRARMSKAARSRFERELAAGVTGERLLDFVLGNARSLDSALTA